MASVGFVKRVKTFVLGVAAAALIRAIYASIRWQVVIPTSCDRGKSQFFAFWHGRMLMLPIFYRRHFARKLYIMISQHGDGRLIALAVKLLGIDSVAGSSTRGGAKAALEMIKLVEGGDSIGITPDGPKGPRYICKSGVVTLAQQTGLTVQPITYSTQRHWTLSSWDSMIIPVPFSRGVVLLGDPISIEPGCDRDEAVKKIQDSLHEITERADNFWRDR